MQTIVCGRALRKRLLSFFMIGREIQAARKKAGISQEELAHRAGIHRTYVSLLERDRRSPTVDVVFRICRALNISAAKLVGRAERRLRGKR